MALDAEVFEKKQEERRLARDIAIFTKVAQGVSVSQVSREYKMASSVGDKLLQEVLKMIFADLKEKGEEDSHPFTQEKYPHLWTKVQGEPQLALYMIKRKEIMAEKDFLISKLHMGLKRPAKGKQFGDTFTEAQLAQQQKVPLHMFKAPRSHRGYGR